MMAEQLVGEWVYPGLHLSGHFPSLRVIRAGTQTGQELGDRN